jgi:Terminase-like family.
MKEAAKQLDADTDALMERWSGRPDLLIEDLLQVRDLNTKDVKPLELTPYQRQFVHALWYGDESTINVLKGRRTGYSFIACAAILIKAFTTPHSFYAITAPSKSQAKDRIDDIYDLMEWAKIDFTLEVDNRDEIVLANGASMLAFAGNPDTSRGGDSADILYIDEMDFLEDQEESLRAFSPFVLLGDATTIEVSTPKLKNGLFMQDQKNGSPKGENGIISIEQPAFNDANKIDEQRPLIEQDVEPAMPYLDVEKAERDRQRDPDGFRQEYLCEPVEDQYRFFDETVVGAAFDRGDRADYVYAPVWALRTARARWLWQWTSLVAAKTILPS